MNRILFSLIILTFALSETILIPVDYATIQDGIVDILDIVQIVNYILAN